jgi:hypothetical protein
MILRRRALVVALAVVSILAGAAVGQYRRQQASKGPRAVAVIEFDAKGVAHLVPVTVLIEGKWYDAGLYKADPVPMALEPETVYEAMHNGEPVGLFTVTEPGTINGAWVAKGRWREGVEPPVKEAKVEAKAASPEDERPILRRPGAEKKTETPPPPAPKPEATPPPPPPKPAEPPEEAPRPVLHRGKPAGAEQAEKLPGDVTGPSAIAPAKSAAAGATAAPARVLVAVSDAKNNEFRPFNYPWNAEERQKLTRQMTDLALAELNAYARAHPGPSPAATLQDVQVHAFDLDLSNEPELVLTARVGEAPPEPPRPAAPKGRGTQPRAAVPQPEPAFGGSVEFYVTVVARQDFNLDLHKLFSAVTDNKHLDAYPRLELIDAVDADGNGRGELLFRRINDQGRSFIIYRVGADELSELYDSGAPLEQ